MAQNYSETLELFTDAAKFGWLDWCLFIGMLILSVGTGLYFAYIAKKKKPDVSDYLMGKRQMRTFPVAMSLIGSYVSGVTVVGTPSEVYKFGTQYTLIIFSILIAGLIVAQVYLPVYFVLQIESSYQYLEFRFNSYLRVLASFIFLFDEIMFLPIVIWVPSLAFSQVTGYNVYAVGCTVCIICIFYTVLGGLKAVVWTDTWQVAVMFAAIIIFAILGTVKGGGFENIFEKAREGNRLELFNLNPSMYQKHTVWAVLFGGSLYWIAFNAINQTMVQRYLTLPTMKQAKLSVHLFAISAFFCVGLCCYMGIVIYEKLGSCDPLEVGALTKSDQLLPAYISIISIGIPGILGVFVAGIFGAALSSMSVILNSAATVVLEDMVKGLGKKHPGDRLSTRIARITIVALGVFSMVMLLVVSKLKDILETATSLSSIAASVMFGVFTLGMLWPWANSYGAFIGALCGMVIGSWLSFGGQYAAAKGYYPPDIRKPSLEGCPDSFNKTLVWPPENYVDPDEFFSLYKLSYHWILPTGILTTIVVGVLVSACTQKYAEHYTSMDPDLFSPIIHRFFPEEMMKKAGTTKAQIIRNRQESLLHSTSNALLNVNSQNKPSSSEEKR